MNTPKRKASSAWKHAERRAAAALGGRRHVRASRGESAPDVDHPLLSIECTYRKRLPLLLTEAMAQAKRYATDNKVPAVVLFQRGSPGGYVVLSLGDFSALHGPLQATPDASPAPADADALAAARKEA